MSAIAQALRGRRLSGVIALSPRSLAVAFEGKPRHYLWIHLERKEAWYAYARDLPRPPDPRGSRYGALEDAIRGLHVVRAEGAPETGLVLGLAAAEGGSPTVSLEISTQGPRANLIAAPVSGDTELWAFHREAAGDAPAGFHPPRAHAVEEAAEREALRERIARAFLEDFRREMHRDLEAAERQLGRRLQAQRGDLQRARDQVASRRLGETLLAHYGDIPRGASRVRLPDPFDGSPGALIEVALDPALTTHENAARLFQRAKKGERGERLVETRLQQTRESLAALEALRGEVETRDPKEALRLLGAFLRDAGLDSVARGDTRGIRLGRRTTAAPRARHPGRRSSGAHHSTGPRTLFTSDGWEVWVGRNNADNDRITHRLSNPHDFWFHVVGVPGSHVILRRPNRTAIPKPRTLGEAASIAAYYSKARKLTRVPVIYTERKFVSKPRRGKPGLAICTRERELLVRPGLPDTDPG
jgi:predicted ribosome quality control (RQC) complex YloA/Tae2 family protein